MMLWKMVFKIILYFFVLVAVIILGAWLTRRGQDKAERVAMHVIGMTKKRAIKHLRQNHLPFRVASENNVDFYTSTSYKPNRVNLHINNRKVVDAEVG